MHLNLHAHRCPNAQVLVNRALEAFHRSMDKELVIVTIEPSMQRSVAGRIAGNDLPLQIADVKTSPISEMDKQSWVLNDFDEEDFSDVGNIVTLTVTKL
jgi:hypothetical protein